MSRLNIDMELVRTFTPEQYARGLLAWAWLRPGPMARGSFETDNIVVVDFVVKLTVAGQLHDQVSRHHG